MMGDIDSCLAEVDGGTEQCRESIFASIEQGLVKNPNGVALVVMFRPPTYLDEVFDKQDSMADRDDACFTCTFSQLHRAAMKLAYGLKAKGIEAPATLVSFLHIGVEYSLLAWTKALTKITFSPLDPDALQPTRKEELDHLMTALRPNVAIVPDAASATSLRSTILALGIEMPLIVVAYEDVAEPSITMIELARTGAKYPGDENLLLKHARRFDEARRAYCVFTSGTSVGKPKGCPHTERTAAHGLQHLKSWPPLINGRPCSLLFMASFRVTAVFYPLATWWLGGTVVVPSRQFDPNCILDAIETYQVTEMSAAPALLRAIVQHPTFESRKLESVKLVNMGADVITPATLALAQKAFPHASTTVLYGMTEGGALLNWPFLDSKIEDIPFLGNVCPMGKIKPGARIRIWDVENGRVAKRGEPGEVHINSSVVIAGYLDGFQAEQFYDDGCGHWFKTGDLGLINDEGLVYILGRLKDVIKRSAIPVVAAALESCLQRYTGSQASVVAMPSERHGHEPFAVLKDFGGKSEDELKAEIVEKCGRDYALAGAATLRQLSMNEFPLNATGKVMKPDIQEAVLRHLSNKA